MLKELAEQCRGDCRDCTRTQQCMNLIPAIREIEEEISNIKSRQEQELRPYLDSLDNLKKINTVCEDCAGTGKKKIRTCAEDEGTYKECRSCGGTGRVK